MMTLVAACAFGLEALVKRELIALGFEDARVSQPGRVEFAGDWSAVCTTNLWLRVADRVLLKVLEFPAADFDALFDTVKDHDWSELLSVESAFPVTGRSRLSQLTSVPAIQRTVKKAIVESLTREHKATELPETGATYKIDVAILNDVATLTIDTTGNSLHKRGYRRLTGKAPIKETLAAALVDLSVWKPHRMLVDPFCGTGTIAIEAAMIGMNIAPGLDRDFASSDWMHIPQTMWNEARAEAKSKIDRDIELQIIGTDIDAEPLEMARFHARNAGIAKQIHFQQKEFANFRSDVEYGCIVTNPPYGERLEDQKSLVPLYETFPGVLHRVDTWSLFVITNMPNLERIFEKRATRRRKLFNGRIECTYYQYLGPRPPIGYFDEPRRPSRTTTGTDNDTNAESETNDDAKAVAPVANSKPATAQKEPAHSKTNPQTKPIFGGLEPKDHEQAELFRSRLIKRAKHLRRWPQKRGITCFRIYEKDIPEIPLVVDRYENSLHITEYERPHDRAVGRHAGWLELMKETAASALDVDIEQTHLKSRARDAKQYDKVGDHKRRQTVREGGLNFLVNLTDYVDTGLFLDHRKTREMVRKEAKGKRVLNLFAYTGSFTVYAAAGRAATTMTIDLSKNYLQWAQANLEANGLMGPQHRFRDEDTIEFLKMAVAQNAQYDLCVVDPPTYSNSKRTEADWDVQQRHVELLNLISEVMAPNGVVYFSTNFRRFKFAESAINGFQEIREITKQTLPEDFRNQRIHRCWRMVKENDEHEEGEEAP
jgi:23S rRNA (guanine2445-N2)-methyltransferase / 23S rRNA (guanine2069-N7)-methyltransferase